MERRVRRPPSPHADQFAPAETTAPADYRCLRVRDRVNARVCYLEIRESCGKVNDILASKRAETNPVIRFLIFKSNEIRHNCLLAVGMIDSSAAVRPLRVSAVSADLLIYESTRGGNFICSLPYVTDLI